MRQEDAMVLIMTTFILAGAGLMLGTIVNRRKIREMEHRERLAMIERGLMPSPETDPMRFEAAAGFTPARDSAADHPARRPCATGRPASSWLESDWV